ESRQRQRRRAFAPAPRPQHRHDSDPRHDQAEEPTVREVVQHYKHFHSRNLTFQLSHPHRSDRGTPVRTARNSCGLMSTGTPVSSNNKVVRRRVAGGILPMVLVRTKEFTPCPIQSRLSTSNRLSGMHSNEAG